MLGWRRKDFFEDTAGTPAGDVETASPDPGGPEPGVPDPGAPEIDAWLATLDEREELVMRLALRGLSSRARGNRAWKQRINELMARYGGTPQENAQLQRAARHREGVIRRYLR